MDELRIDQTEVADLSPIGNLPLRVLSFRQTLVQDVSPLDQISSLRCVLGQNGEGVYDEILPPLPDQETWINAEGMKFRRLPGRSVMLAEKEYSVGSDSPPVTSISYREAIERCKHLTKRDRSNESILHEHSYRLPTDGEWSLAARLPESQFLSPLGRRLQRITGHDYSSFAPASRRLHQHHMRCTGQTRRWLSPGRPAQRRYVDSESSSSSGSS